MKTNTFKQASAFTLVALLVVMAIVAIVSSLALAGFSVARENAKNTESMTNLRQIASAMHGYAAENNNLFPRGYFYKPGEGEISYVTELIPYIGDAPSPVLPKKNIFIAPTSKLE